MVKYSNLIKVSFLALYCVQQRPRDNRKRAQSIAAFFIMAALAFLALTSVLLWDINGDVDLFARIIEAMTTWSQMFVKVIPLYIQRDRFIYLYEKHLSFWNPDDFDESLQKKCEETYKVAYRIVVIYAFLVYATRGMFYLQPIFKPDDLLFICYVPSQIPYAFEILLVGQYFYGFAFSGFVIGVDILYVVYCTHLIVQLKIINHTLRHIDIADKHFLNDFKVLIEYHKVLLVYAAELISFWSIPSLGQYFLSIYMSCMELYLFIENLSNWNIIILSVVYCTCLYVQFALYCFPATYFISEAEKLAVSIYDSKWYEGSISMQKNVRFVMMRAQKQFHFYAAGLAEINCEAFIVVFKASMSFLTLMRQMKKETIEE